MSAENDNEKTSVFSLNSLNINEDTYETDLNIDSNNSHKVIMLIVKKGPNAGARFLVKDKETYIGRNVDSDIILDDITVSRTHAKLSLNDNELFISDLNSLNGTYLNKESIKEARLSNGDEIQIGKFRLKVINSYF